MSSYYRWKFTQAGADSTYELEHVLGDDVYNVANRPLIYGADDETPWNCRCASKMGLMTPESLVSPARVNCSVCVSPNPAGIGIECDSDEADTTVALRETQGIILRWGPTIPYWITATPGEAFAVLSPCSPSYNWREGSGTFSSSDTHDDWAAEGLPSFDLSTSGCGTCGQIAVWPPTAWLPGYVAVNGFTPPFISSSDGWGECGTDGNPFLIDVFGAILLRTSGPSTGYYVYGEWIDLP